MVITAVQAATEAVATLFLQQAETEVTAETAMVDLSAMAALAEKEHGLLTEVRVLTVNRTQIIRITLKISIKL